MDAVTQPDEILVRKAREGDREAFDALVRRYQLQAVLMAQTVLRNFELAKDASQNAFAKAYFGLKGFREQAKFKTWFFRIVLNEAKDVRRKEQARGMFRFWTGKETEENEQPEAILEIIPSRERSVRETLDAEAVKKKVEEAVDRLPERERDVFILRYFQELPITEVAEVLGMAIGTVKAHLAQGSQRLKAILLAERQAYV